jgi:hypothetical protein
VAAGSTRWLAGFILGASPHRSCLKLQLNHIPINRNRSSNALVLSEAQVLRQSANSGTPTRDGRGKSKNNWRTSAIAGDKVEMQFGTSPVHSLACLSKQRLHVPAVQSARCMSICTPTSIQDIAASFAPTFLIPTSRVKTA